jgi:hypothetical protein
MKTFDTRRMGAFVRFELASRRQENLLPLLIPPGLVALWALMRLATGRGFDAWPELAFSLGLLLSLGGSVGAHRRQYSALPPHAARIPR